MKVTRLILLATLALCVRAQQQNPAALALHPDNPHYFLFRGKPAVLIGSTEHYGAVMNLDFDYLPYLDELGKNGLNLTRTFSGTYREIPASFGITDNPLAPKAERYIGPWPRGDKGGAGDGLNKFDLTRFDDKYFDRLRDFVAQAGRHGVVVEYVLFCTFYNDALWDVNPMNPKNHDSNVGDVPRREVYTLKHPELLKIQDAFVKKAVTELNAFDNVYFEICNEPYFEGVSDDWQAHVARTIADTERNLPNKHLVAQNIANNQKKVDKLTPGVSILNFHYARPPETVAMNYAHNVAIGDDETGFDGKEDVHYRTEGWDFVLAGGATYNNLDYSFTPKTPGGTLSEFKSPGGGSARLRRSLGALKKFMDGLDFVHMKPMNAVVKGGRAAVAIGQPSRSGSAARSGQISIRVLGQEGKAYALYLHGGTSAELKLDLPAGKYQAEWIDPRTGEVGKSEAIEHGGGERTFTSPDYTQDIALRIVARAGQP